MSHITAKKARKVEEEKQKDFDTRREAFMKEIKESALKYKVDLVATLQYGDLGLVPRVTIVDIKEKFGHVTEEMKDNIARA